MVREEEELSTDKPLPPLQFSSGRASLPPALSESSSPASTHRGAVSGADHELLSGPLTPGGQESYAAP